MKKKKKKGGKTKGKQKKNKRMECDKSKIEMELTKREEILEKVIGLMEQQRRLNKHIAKILQVKNVPTRVDLIRRNKKDSYKKYLYNPDRGIVVRDIQLLHDIPDSVEFIFEGYLPQKCCLASVIVRISGCDYHGDINKDDSEIVVPLWHIEIRMSTFKVYLAKMYFSNVEDYIKKTRGYMLKFFFNFISPNMNTSFVMTVKDF